jgi:hypothetical protein
VTSTPAKIVLIDESDDIIHGGASYVVASAVVLTSDAAELAADLRTVLFENPRRRRPFHWSEEGPSVRRSILTAVAYADVSAIAVVGSLDGRRGQEQVRYECLRQLFVMTGVSASELVIESRESVLRNVGQNRTDHRAIVDARHARELPPLLRYRWADKAEPLLWAPDAVAGMTLASLRNDRTWLTLFERAGGSLQIVRSDA